MRRLSVDDERGAVTVMFGLLLVMLLGFVGMGVDVASAYAKSQEVQNGADAGALAVAAQCATTGCGGDDALADELADANIRQALLLSTDVSYPAANEVTVVAETDHKNYFLGLFFQPTFRVTEQATAVWGPPSKGTTIMPLAFSFCSFSAQGGASGNPVILYLTKSLDPTLSCLTDPDGNALPGGFAYVGDGPSQCGSEVEADGWIPSQGGNVPQGCDADLVDDYVGDTILLPVFDRCWTTKKNTDDCDNYEPTPPGVSASEDRWYHIYAFAAFEVSGYNFGGQFKEPSTAPPCSGEDRCVAGRFVEWVELEDAWDYSPSAPDLGAIIVTLID